MEVEYPSETEIKRSIEYICDCCVGKKKNIFSLIKDMTESLSVKNVLYGVGDVIIIGLVLSDSMYYALYLYLRNMPNSEEKVYLLTFITAPISFLILFLLSFIKEKKSNVFVVKMTCKYTVYHLLVYRMILFSLLSVLLNTLYIVLVCYEFDIQIITLLSISLSELFIYSSLLVMLLLKFSAVKSIVTLTVPWCVFGFVLYRYQSSYLIDILNSVPVLVWLVIICSCIIVYLNKLPQIVLKRRKHYAYS